MAATRDWYSWLCDQRSISLARSTGSGWLSARVCALLQGSRLGGLGEGHRSGGEVWPTGDEERLASSVLTQPDQSRATQPRPQPKAAAGAHRRYQPTGEAVASSYDRACSKNQLNLSVAKSETSTTLWCSHIASVQLAHGNSGEHNRPLPCPPALPRACARNASTDSSPAKAGDPPASFMSTEMTTLLPWGRIRRGGEGKEGGEGEGTG